MLHAKITAKGLVNESGLNEEIKTFATEEEIKKLAAKVELKKIVKPQTYYLSLFIGMYGAQFYLILHLLYYTLTPFWLGFFVDVKWLIEGERGKTCPPPWLIFEWKML